jgi:heme-degrading monooxygenase HmoA
VISVAAVTIPTWEPAADRSDRLVGMVVEIAEFRVPPGAEDDFLLAYRGVRGVLTSTGGCRSARMTRGVETPNRFVLLVEWDSLEAHTQNFRGSDRFTTWRRALAPFFAADPHVEHFQDV